MTDTATTEPPGSIADRVRERIITEPPDFGPARPSLEMEVADPSLSLADRVRRRQQLLEEGTITPPPLEIDREIREGSLARRAGVEALGEPGLDDFGLRFDLGFSDTFQEQQTKFLERFPDGEFILVDDPPLNPRDASPRRPTTVLFRRHPGEDFAEVDARVIDRLELAGDLADLSGELPALAAESIALIATRGGSLFTQLAATFGANLGAEAITQGVEELRGFQQEQLGDIAFRGSLEAGFATAGGLGGAMLSGPLNMFRGASMIALRPGAREAQEAARRLGVNGLLPTQVANSPLIRKTGNQIAGASQGVNDYVIEQQGQAVSALLRLRDEDLTRFVSGELDTLHADALEQILAVARRSTSSLSDTGTALAIGVKEYDELASTIVNQAYRNARGIEAPAFDITPLQEVARRTRIGIQGQERATTSAVDTGLLDASGRPITRTETTVNLRTLNDVRSQLDAVAADIAALDPSLPTTNVGTANEATAIDQLRAIRSRLWDLKTPNPGEIFRDEHRQAAQLYGAVTHALRNPTNANPAFRQSWDEANQLAFDRYDTLEKLIITEAGKTETPALLARRMIAPDQVDNLRILKDSIPEARWREFQDGARAFMLEPRNVNRLNQVLDTFDEDTLNLVFTGQDQRALRQIAGTVEQLNDAGIQQVLQRQSEGAAVVRELVRNNRTRQVDELVSLVDSLPPDHPSRATLRAGLVESVYQDVVTSNNGVNIVNGERLRTILDELDRSGAARLLSDGDRQVLNDLQAVADFLPARNDMGASLEAASLAEQARGQIHNPSKSFIFDMIEIIGIGRMFTSPVFQRIVLGKGVSPRAFTSLRVAGAILGDAAANVGPAPPEGEPQQRFEQLRQLGRDTGMLIDRATGEDR